MFVCGYAESPKKKAHSMAGSANTSSVVSTPSAATVGGSSGGGVCNVGMVGNVAGGLAMGNMGHFNAAAMPANAGQSMYASPFGGLQPGFGGAMMQGPMVDMYANMQIPMMGMSRADDTSVVATHGHLPQLPSRVSGGAATVAVKRNIVAPVGGSQSGGGLVQPFASPIGSQVPAQMMPQMGNQMQYSSE